MKLIRLAAILGVFVTTTLALAWTLGWVHEAEALETLKKSLIVIGILTVATGSVLLISKDGSKDKK